MLPTKKSTIKSCDIKKIFTNYNLGEVKSFDSFEAGTVQTNILVYTTRGRFVLRYYERNRSFHSVLFEVNLIKYLKKRKYPCPDILRNKRGKFAAYFNNKPYAIFEFIEGVHIEQPNEKQRLRLIEKVAQLQNLTKNYRPTYTRHRWNYGIELCEILAENIATELATESAQKKLIWYRRQLSELVLPMSLPKGICHCDFHFSNVLFEGNTFCALLDFDDANYTFLTFDLACLIDINLFIPSFGWNTWHHFGLDDEIFNFKSVKRTVSEYQKFRPLNSVEKKYFFDVYKLSVLIDCLWFFERGNSSSFYEQRKIQYLNRLGRDSFYCQVFG